MYEDEICAIAFAYPEMVRHLLALLPAEATAGLDPSRLRRLPGMQIGRGARRRVADMAWAVGAPTPERPGAEALLVILAGETPALPVGLEGIGSARQSTNRTCYHRRA